MVNDPLNHILKRGSPCCHIQYHIGQFFLCVGKLNSIQRQKNQHSVCADPFIDVHKSMIPDQPKAKSAAFCCRDGKVSISPKP